MSGDSGSGFEIAQAHLTITAEPDDSSVESATSSMGSRMTKWAAGLGLGALISKGLTDNLDASNANSKLQAQLGLTKDVALNMGKVSGEVYRDNFGDSMDQVNESIQAIGTNFGDVGQMSKTEIKGMSEAALGLSSVFDVDVKDSTEAAAKMVKNGLAKNSTEAFDIITKGFQSGADRSGDFLDTLNEYSPQFTKLGFSGAQSMGVMSQAIKAGARDTDGIADAFKEFSLRAIDGSTLTASGFKSIGLNAKTMGEQIAAGGPQAEKATEQTIKALQAMKDPVKQNIAGTALFGTQWEDTLRVVLPSIDLAKAATTDVAGSTQQMNDVMGSTPTAKVETFKRQMEGLLMSATQLPGPLGTVGTGIASMGSGAITSMAGITTMAATMGGPVTAAIGTATSATWSWISAQAASAARGVASMATTVATTVAGWITQAATAVASAAVIAAAWLVAYWPIALIVAAVIGLVVVIVMNWDTIKRVTVELWNSIWEFTKMVWNEIVNAVKAGIDFVVYLFMNWTIYGIVIKHWRDILNFITGTISSVKNTVSGGLNSVKSTVNSVLSATAGVVSSQFNRVRNYASDAIGAVRSTVTSGINGARNAVTSAVGTITNTVGTIKGKATSALSGLGSLLFDSGRSLISGFISGMLSKLSDVGGAASSIVGKAKNFFPWSPAKEGPLSGDGYTDVSGAKMVTDFAGGMLSKAPEVASAADATLQGVHGAFAAPRASTAQATGGGAEIHLTVPVVVNSMTIPSDSDIKAFCRAIVQQMNEALRLYTRGRVGVATT